MYLYYIRIIYECQVFIVIFTNIFYLKKNQLDRRLERSMFIWTQLRY
nr:MAG TPA: hypothetical protein [Caudoviricetes sp.]